MPGVLCIHSILAHPQDVCVLPSCSHPGDRAPPAHLQTSRDAPSSHKAKASRAEPQPGAFLTFPGAGTRGSHLLGHPGQPQAMPPYWNRCPVPSPGGSASLPEAVPGSIYLLIPLL